MKKFNKLTEKQMSKARGGFIGLVITGVAVAGSVIVGAVEGAIAGKKDKS